MMTVCPSVANIGSYLHSAEGAAVSHDAIIACLWRKLIVSSHQGDILSAIAREKFTVTASFINVISSWLTYNVLVLTEVLILKFDNSTDKSYHTLLSMFISEYSLYFHTCSITIGVKSWASFLGHLYVCRNCVIDFWCFLVHSATTSDGQII